MRLSLPAVLLCLIATHAHAETVYVTDMLRLGLHVAADTSDTPFENLTSGAPLEVLERTSSYLHVRTADGLEGWVKAAYTVDDKPARFRVAELEAELEGLRAEVDAARTARSTAEREASQLGAAVAATVDSTEAVAATLARLQRENESYTTQLERYRSSVPLTWAAAALVVALVAGFLAGLWWLDALIRRRHGGFRVY